MVPCILQLQYGQGEQTFCVNVQVIVPHYSTLENPGLLEYLGQKIFALSRIRYLVRSL